MSINLIAWNNLFDVIFSINESSMSLRAVIFDLTLHSSRISSRCLFIFLLRSCLAIRRISRRCISFRIDLLLNFLVLHSLIILGRNSNLRELLLHGLWDDRNWICEHIVINRVLHGIAIGSIFSNLLYVFCQIRELTQLSIGDLPVLVVVPHFLR